MKYIIFAVIILYNQVLPDDGSHLKSTSFHPCLMWVTYNAFDLCRREPKYVLPATFARMECASWKVLKKSLNLIKLKWRGKVRSARIPPCSLRVVSLLIVLVCAGWRGMSHCFEYLSHVLQIFNSFVVSYVSRQLVLRSLEPFIG
jgi:hypothetical protein